MIEYHSHKIQNAIQKELFKAQSSIRIAVAWFTNDLLFQPLLLKLSTGVKVEIILNKDNINCSKENEIDFDRFVEYGGVLRWNTTKQLLHDKFCIIDDNVVIAGSYNWTKKAEYNEESVAIFKDEGGTSKFYMDRFQKLFGRYIEECHEDIKKYIPTEIKKILNISFRELSSDLRIIKNVYDIVEYRGRKGVSLTDGNIVLDLKYQDICKVGDFLCVKRFKEDSQLYDVKAKCFVGPTFEKIKYGKEDDSIRKDLTEIGWTDYIFENKGKLGCLDYSGQIIIGCEYDSIEHIGWEVWSYAASFHYAYRVLKNNSVGLCDEWGKMIIPCEYEDVVPLWDGAGHYPMYYMVKKHKYSFFCPKEGKKRTDFLYDDFKVLTYYSYNIWVGKNEKYALLSPNLDILTDFVFDGAIKICNKYEESKTKYIVSINKKYGLIDTGGNILIDCQYEELEELDIDGLYKTKFNDKYGVCSDVAVVIHPEYDSVVCSVDQKGELFVIVENNREKICIKRLGGELRVVVEESVFR